MNPWTYIIVILIMVFILEAVNNWASQWGPTIQKIVLVGSFIVVAVVCLTIAAELTGKSINI